MVSIVTPGIAVNLHDKSMIMIAFYAVDEILFDIMHYNPQNDLTVYRDGEMICKVTYKESDGFDIAGVKKTYSYDDATKVVQDIIDGIKL